MKNGNVCFNLHVHSILQNMLLFSLLISSTSTDAGLSFGSIDIWAQSSGNSVLTLQLIKFKF